MELGELKKNWDAFGEQDPFWAILTDPAKKGGKWDPDEFFATGIREIESVIKYISSLSIHLARKRALDFGCGVGRLTQALCRYFEECSGVDIAPSMIHLAEQFNQFGERCRYFVNARDDLSLFNDDTFDFIYSVIVLQHLKPEYSTSYIKEFTRILTPHGLLIFQIPSEPEPVVSGEVLPIAAFRTNITFEERRLTLQAGTPYTLKVNVQNASGVVWPDLRTSKYPLRIGNHWLSPKEEMLLNDDGRADIPCQLLPSKNVDVFLTITTPPIPGSYILELDLVQEVVSWFKNKGSLTKKIWVKVEKPTGRQKSPTAQITLDESSNNKTFIPRMELFGIRSDVVIDLVQQRGCKVIDIRQDNSLGGWASFLYTVIKDY